MLSPDFKLLAPASISLTLAPGAISNAQASLSLLTSMLASFSVISCVPLATTMLLLPAACAAVPVMV